MNNEDLDLEEAIKHLESLIVQDLFSCKECKKEHQKLLRWLIELKEYRQK